MPLGSTTSKAEMRSVATMTMRSSSMLYTSRTLPWYTLFCPSKWNSVFVNAFIVVCFVCVYYSCDELMPDDVALREVHHADAFHII